MTRERPILFSAPMVRAILDGRKMQTRRALRVQPLDVLPMEGDKRGIEWVGMTQREPEPKGLVFACKFGQPGDRLWVKETFFDTDPFRAAHLFADRATRYAYRADEEFIGCHKWKPSIHMPRAASRLLLEVTAVRVERLHEISEADSLAEGIKPFYSEGSAPSFYGLNDEGCGFGTAGSWRFKDSGKQAYETLWERINGAGSWATNPWVWVIEFRRAQP